MARPHSVAQRIETALGQKWPARYARTVAVGLACGAAVHLANILGLGARAWSTFPTHLRIMDVLLLAFDLAVAVGLWRKQTWSVYGLFLGMAALQLVPYTVFRSAFVQSAGDAQVLDGLLALELVMLLGFALLLWRGGLRRR